MLGMTGDTIASFVYLSVLLIALGSMFFVGQRVNWGQTARTMGTWLLIFVGFIAAYGLWNDVQGQFQPMSSAVLSEDAISVPRQRDGHFHLTLDVNGTPVDFLVDTGATDVVLSQSDARRVGLDPEDLRFTFQAQTANGAVDIAPVRLEEVVLGEFTDRNVRASVNGGELNVSLLGMSYLSRFETLQIQDNRLTLIR